jgi:hypothetical protein
MNKNAFLKTAERFKQLMSSIIKTFFETSFVYRLGVSLYKFIYVLYKGVMLLLLLTRKS